MRKMSSFDEALKVVINAIGDEPSLLNTLPHDILRKLIFHVGELVDQTAYVKGKTYKIRKIIEALNRNATEEVKNVELYKCDLCDYIEASPSDQTFDRIEYCSHVKCYRVVCPECGDVTGCCTECSGYTHKDCRECRFKETI
jgi:hypothetical protein